MNTSIQIMDSGKSLRGYENAKKNAFELRDDLNIQYSILQNIRYSDGFYSSKKSLYHLYIKQSVPETGTSRQVSYTKGRERLLSKELGKMTP